jgi:putative hydrolase of the HAD superfamily
LCIIFDLDDTLVDTSSFISYKLKLIQERLQEEGLVGIFDRLCELDRTCGSTKPALEALLAECGREELFEVASDLLDMPPPQNVQIRPLPGAVELLGQLKKKFLLCLVSKGRPSLQLEKLKRAGFDRSLFCRIVILEEGSKKKAYSTLLEELQISPKKWTVCGDRPEIDLLPAKELGARTIHMKWGRGAYLESDPRVVDHIVHDMRELSALLTP